MKTCARCAGHGCSWCDHQGVIPIPQYPPGYNSMRQLRTDWTLDIPIQHPEMVIWGSSLVAAAFMVAAPRVVAGFAGLGMSDDEFLKAEELFANHAYQFDRAVDCQTMRRRLNMMKREWANSGYDGDLGKQLVMRMTKLSEEC